MRRLVCVPVLMIALVCGACGGGTDYYSSVKDKCSYTATFGLAITDTDAAKTSLTDDCKKALEAILPYDDSFKSAPDGFKNKITEAFQALIGYPLKFPDNGAVFGVPGVLLPWNKEIFESDPDPNQSIFNYVVSAFSSIRYNPDINQAASAHYGVDFALNGIVTFFPEFWTKDAILSYNFTMPFLRAGTLVHEARHAYGYLHVPCPDGTGFNCDTQVDGPYGLSVSYYEALFRGSGNIRPDGSDPFLGDMDITLMGAEICADFIGGVIPAIKLPDGTVLQPEKIVSPKISNTVPALLKLLSGVNCQNKGTAYFANLENLRRPPPKQ